MLNKRAVGQLLPDRRHVKAIQKVAPYFSRAVTLLFAWNVNNKSYHFRKIFPFRLTMPQFGFYNLWHRNAHAFQPHRNRLKKRKTVTKTVSHRWKLQRAGAGARPVRVELVENPFRVVRSNGIRGRSGFQRAEAFAGNTGSGYLVGSNVSFRRYRSAYFPAELICSGRML